MGKYLLFFMIFSITAFSIEQREKMRSNQEQVAAPAKKIKPHFAGVRRGATKLKIYKANLKNRQLGKKAPQHSEQPSES